MQIKDIKYDDKSTWKKYKKPIYVVLERTNIETGIENGLEHWKFQDGEKCFNQTTHLFKNGDITGNKLKTNYLGIFTTEEEMLACFDLYKQIGHKVSIQFETPKEENTMIQVNTFITKELKDSLDTYCTSTGRLQKDVIVMAIEKYLDGKNQIIEEIQKLQKLLKDKEN